jgi:Kef-type K+ transport system membrane component KefB
MGFGTLAVIAVAGLVGPILAVRSSWNVPVVLGELLAGLILGASGLGWLNAADPTFSFLADIGFALVMFVAGSHVPVRDIHLRAGLGKGAARAAAVGVVAALLGYGGAELFGTGNALLYGLLMASSSAALILPIIDSLHLHGPAVLQLIPQIAVADAACIVALPLIIDPPHAGRAAIGAVLVIGGAALLFVGLKWLQRTGVQPRVHRLSERRKFAIELRVSLAVLFALAAVAAASHVSIMLAGFGCGLAVAAVGQPRRVAKQLFALTEGFLGPLFFVWLGASLDVHSLVGHPSVMLLGLYLGVGASLAHQTMRVTGQPLSIGALACAQLGVPVAAATLATQLHLLGPGEAPALILGALITIAVSTIGGGLAARRFGGAGPTSPTTPPPAGQPPTPGPPHPPHSGP